MGIASNSMRRGKGAGSTVDTRGAVMTLVGRREWK